MVWAGIFHGGRTQLKIVQGTLDAVKYREDILDPTVLSFLQQRNFDHVFQHDNARSHVARVCQDFLNQNPIRVLPWPALSPDMSPIEYLWDELGRRVRLYPTIDWFYASEMRSCRCCKRWQHTLLNSANLHTA
jgi:transposase